MEEHRRQRRLRGSWPAISATEILDLDLTGLQMSARADDFGWTREPAVEPYAETRLCSRIDHGGSASPRGSASAPGRRLQRRPTPRPGIPFRDSALLVNGHKDLQIGSQVAREIQSADRIDLLCAFVRFAGVRLIRRELKEFVLRGGQMRVIASIYTGRPSARRWTTSSGGGESEGLVRDQADPPAREGMAISTRYRVRDGLRRIIKPTHSALVDGLEWNVRALMSTTRRILRKLSRRSSSTGMSPNLSVRPGGGWSSPAGGT